MSSSYADFDELYADKFFSKQGSFNFVKLDGHWAYKAETVNLSMQNSSFTTLNNLSKDTFAHIANLNSDTQSQIDNVSLVPKD